MPAEIRQRHRERIAELLFGDATTTALDAWKDDLDKREWLEFGGIYEIAIGERSRVDLEQLAQFVADQEARLLAGGAKCPA